MKCDFPTNNDRDESPHGQQSHRSRWHARENDAHQSHFPAWRSKRRFLLRRFFRYSIIFGLLFFGGMTIFSYLASHIFGGNRQTAALVWVTFCGLLLLLPLIVMGLGMRAYSGVAKPLANVMAAADSVAEGDLTARVPEQGAGEFARLTKSFNRMVEELEQSDQQRRNLTADVAHELRTPLHIIQGNLEGILDGVYEPTPEHIQATLEETRALARLVNDLRTLSLAEAGQLQLVYEAIDVNELLEDIETSFGTEAEAQGIKLNVATNSLGTAHADERNQQHIMGDPGRLDQVLSNLIVNALRHTAAGGEITVQADTMESGVRLAVKDSGEGISDEDLPYIFDRFWRGDRARTHADGVGGGLGLAIARQLVEAHKGQISVESKVGRGTTFTIDLPSVLSSV